MSVDYGEVNTDSLDGFSFGDGVQFASRPEYGDSVRVVAVKRAGRVRYDAELKIIGYVVWEQIVFIPRAALCPLDCGHRVPGGTLYCTKEG